MTEPDTAHDAAAGLSTTGPGPVRRDLSALASRSDVYAATDILRQTVNFLLLPLYTTYLSTDDYGALSIALAALAVLLVTRTITPSERRAMLDELVRLTSRGEGTGRS